MKTIIFVLILIVDCLFAQSFNSLQSNKTAIEVVELTYNQNFDSAETIVKERLHYEGQNLFWKYIKGMISYRKSLAIGLFNEGNDDDLFMKEKNKMFNSVYEVAIKGDSLLKINTNDTLALFYTGASYGYIGLYYSSLGENFKAASEGKKGMEYHDRLIKLVPNFGDTYLSKGIFNYYASNVPWYITPVLWILGSSGSEDDAIYYFNKVISNGKLAIYEAAEMLCKLYIRRKNTIRANEIISNLLSRLINSRYYYTYLFGIDFFNNDLLQESNALLERGILLSKKDGELQNYKKEIEKIYVRLAMNHKLNGNYKETITVLLELIEREINPENKSLYYLVIGDSYALMNEMEKAKEYFSWILKYSQNIEVRNKANEKIVKYKLYR